MACCPAFHLVLLSPPRALPPQMRRPSSWWPHACSTSGASSALRPHMPRARRFQVRAAPASAGKLHNLAAAEEGPNWARTAPPHLPVAHHLHPQFATCWHGRASSMLPHHSWGPWQPMRTAPTWCCWTALAWEWACLQRWGVGRWTGAGLERHCWMDGACMGVPCC